jgi:hypothetical protein
VALSVDVAAATIGRAGAEARATYRRHHPEQTVLYRLVAEHWPSFRERAEEVGAVPEFVVREFEEYLRCGMLEHGFVELVCRHCGHTELVAFSCKHRGICPSCVGRRMADTAVHLEQSVLPRVHVRHWICTLPWGVRALLGYDRKLCAEVVSAFVEEASRSLRLRAKRSFGLATVADAFTGAVAAVQRTDGAVRLNVHLHVLVLDGVYVREEASGQLEFHRLPTPTQAEVAEVARRTAERLERILRAHGRSLDRQQSHDAPGLLDDAPGLAACYDAAAQGISVSGERAGQPTLRLVVPHDAPAPKPQEQDQPVAEVRGVNVHAKQVVDGRDRPALERLCRYITRPPISLERLALRQDGRYQVTLKAPWRDGTRALLFEPYDLLARLVAAIPAPRFHMFRYFGLLSSHSKLRREVVPAPPGDPSRYKAPPARGDQLELVFNTTGDASRDVADDASPDALGSRAGRKRWAWLLAHVFRADVETCQKCGGPMRCAEVANDARTIARVLAEHGLTPRTPPPPYPPPLPRGQLRLKFARGFS